MGQLCPWGLALSLAQSVPSLPGLPRTRGEVGQGALDEQDPTS